MFPDIRALAAIPNTDVYLLSARSVLSTQNYLVAVVHSSTCSKYFKNIGNNIDVFFHQSALPLLISSRVRSARSKIQNIGA